MPQLPLNDEEQQGFASSARQKAASVWDSFSDFALRDNVLEVAVGLIFATSFTAATNSLVTDILLPLLSLLPFISHDLPNAFAILRRGTAYAAHRIPRYNTVQQGLDDGAVIWAYGRFIDKVLRFFLVAVALFVIAKVYERVTKDKVVKRQKRCGYCRKWISEKAKRCVNCTSWVDGREDKTV